MSSSVHRLLVQKLRRWWSSRIYHDPFFADLTVVEDDYRRMKRMG